MKPAPIKPTIAYEDFEKVDIRVGTIHAVEEVPDSKKLMQLTVEFGDHRRTNERILERSRAGRPCSCSTWSRVGWPASSPRECSSISATRMG